MPLRKLLEKIRIVLIDTSHPGNIGSAARAMKTMGLADLCLVNPKSFPHEQANALASSAEDILAQAQVVDSLEEAIADCQWVFGSSARYQRSLSWSLLEPRDCANECIGIISQQGNQQNSQQGKVALVFGRESSGLTNEELALCNQLVHIPTNPDYSSLNIASAVQILAYECRLSALEQLAAQQDQKDQTNNKTKKDSAASELISAAELEAYLKHLEEAMITSGFLDPEKPRKLMARLRRLYGRLGMTRSELNILRGMLVAFEKR